MPVHRRVLISRIAECTSKHMVRARGHAWPLCGDSGNQSRMELPLTPLASRLETVLHRGLYYNESPYMIKDVEETMKTTVNTQTCKHSIRAHCKEVEQ